MKTIPAALQAHYDSGGTSVSHALVIQRTDGQLFGFTSNDRPFVLDVTPWGYASSALTFDAKQGLTASNLVSTSGFAVDNMELTTLDDGSLFQRDEVLAGVWRNAQWRIFRYRWDVPAPTIANDVETLHRGTVGEITLGAATIKVELRGLKQLLQQSVGEVSTKTCRNRLGDGRCRVDLAPWTHAGAITAVADKRTFTAAGLAQAADYFGEGVITFTSGANKGLSQKVRTHAAGGVITLVLPMVMTVAVGDQFTAVAGCRKRLMEDCKAKFGNVPNFRGEPHRPTTDDLTRTP
ncbi:phage protein [Comamonas phosphati]|nr:phage protein [Comamonas phosphati]